MPPAGHIIPRIVVKDHDLGNLKIKKGTIVIVPIFAITNEKHNIEPTKFRPDRWLNGEVDKVDNMYKIPFSTGPKNCIG